MAARVQEKVLEFFANLLACLIGIEACPGAHYWARELIKLGHTVKLMPAQHVKAYLKGNKNDGNDAEAICEAVSRPGMRFVAINTEAQQDIQMLPDSVGGVSIGRRPMSSSRRFSKPTS